MAGRSDEKKQAACLLLEFVLMCLKVPETDGGSPFKERRKKNFLLIICDKPLISLSALWELIKEGRE